MVDQEKGGSRPNGLPESLKLSYSFYDIDDRSFWKDEEKADNKKLTRVLFTKLSIDGYNRFVIYAKTTRAQGIIDEPTPSRFLR